MPVISKDDAIKRLPERENVHTFRNTAGILIGADWDKSDILELFEKHEIEETGEMAQGMNHGLAIKDNYGWLFIETSKKEEEVTGCKKSGAQ